MAELCQSSLCTIADIPPLVFFLVSVEPLCRPIGAEHVRDEDEGDDRLMNPSGQPRGMELQLIYSSAISWLKTSSVLVILL